MEETSVFKYFDDLNSEGIESLPDFAFCNLALWIKSGLLDLVLQSGKRARFDTEQNSQKRLALLSDYYSGLEIQKLENLLGPSTPEDVIPTRISNVKAQLREFYTGMTSWIDGEHAVFDRQLLGSSQFHFHLFGSLSALNARKSPFVEYRLHLVVAHSFAKQLLDMLLPSWSLAIERIYAQRKAGCNHDDSPHQAEWLAPEELNHRHFVSAQARVSMADYWAECFAAFSLIDSRNILAEVDPEMHSLLTEFVCKPENCLASPWKEMVMQARAARGVDALGMETYLETEDVQVANSIRAQVMEKIMWHVLKGNPWEVYCKELMLFNNITTADVEAEIQRRKSEQ